MLACGRDLKVRCSDSGRGKSEREDDIREIRGNICLDNIMKPNTLYTI